MSNITELFKGAFAVVVNYPSGRHQRRVFMTIAAAEKAARRATERGHAVEVVLVHLEPVATVTSIEAEEAA